MLVNGNQRNPREESNQMYALILAIGQLNRPKTTLAMGCMLMLATAPMVLTEHWVAGIASALLGAIMIMSPPRS